MIETPNVVKKTTDSKLQEAKTESVLKTGLSSPSIIVILYSVSNC